MSDVDTTGVSTTVEGSTITSDKIVLAEETSELYLTSDRLAQATRKSPVSGYAFVLRSEIRTDKSGRDFIAATIRFADGTVIDGRWWHFSRPRSESPSEGKVFCFKGFGDIYNESQQFCILDARLVPNADVGPFCPSIRRPFSELISALEATIFGLDDPMAALVRAVLSNETYERFCTWPAAQRHHGAVRHGLLAHSLGVVDLAERLTKAYPPDQFPYDRSLLITAALLHDVGKVRTLPAIAGFAFPEDSSRFDHVTLGVLMIQQATASLEPQIETARLDALLHAILAHHGRMEWGAAIDPKTVEAWLVHLADLAESRLWAFSSAERVG